MLEQLSFLKQRKQFECLFVFVFLVLTATVQALKETRAKTLILKKSEPAILSQHSFVYFLGWTIENDDTSYEYKCSGVMIEPATFLGSAHCLLQTDEKPVVARPGIFPPNSLKRNEIPIAKIIVHPKFKPTSSDYDLVIIKFVGHATDNQVRKWLKLDFHADQVKVYCCGQAKYGNADFAYSGPLHSDGPSVVSKKDCQKFDEFNSKSEISSLKRNDKNGYICAREPQKLSNLCLHSLGGPLIMYKPKPNYEVLLGFGCKNCPTGVYTFIPHHMEWIKSTVMSFIHHYVVGGTRAKPGEFPYMSELGWKSRKNDGSIDYKCGGVLIDARYVLTAAHCFYGSEDMPTVIRARGADLSDKSTEDLEIETIIEHPNYKYPSSYNDIALIYLRNPSTSVYVRVWRDEYVNFNETVTVIGYGATKFAGSGSNELLKANLSLMTNDECKKAYDQNLVNVDESIVDTQICAYDKMKIADSCQGDSGGPLVMTVKRGDYVEPLLVGITSFGVGCATAIPGVYTRISKYNDWIKETICEWSNLDCLFRPAKAEKPVFDNIYFLGWTPKGRYGPIDYKCAGALIHYNYVIMPAHCIFLSDTPPDVVCSFGTNKTVDSLRVVPILKIDMYKNYTRSSLYNDVAILKIGFVEDAPCSFWPWDELDKKSIQSHGYINTIFTGIAADVGLLNLELVPDEQCQQYYESLDCVSNYNPNFTDQHFCVRDPQNLHNRGIVGPLIMHVDDAIYNFTKSYIVGLSTMDFKCGNGSMRFYTRVSKHMLWMYESISDIRYSIAGFI